MHIRDRQFYWWPNMGQYLFESIPDLLDFDSWVMTINSIHVLGAILDNSIVFSNGHILIGNAANMSATLEVGLYSLTGNTLSQMCSATLQAGQTASFARYYTTLNFGGTYTLNPGAYWFMVRGSTQSAAALSFGGYTMASQINGQPGIPVYGRYSATSSALPATCLTSDITKPSSANIMLPYILLNGL